MQIRKDMVCCFSVLSTEAGRLDLVSVILATISIALVLSGIFGLISIHNRSKKVAEEVAAKVAHERAEYHTNDYLQKNLWEIIISYDVFAKNSVSSELANKIAGEQE